MEETQITGLRNLKNKKLYMQVYDELRDFILQEQLRPGDKLPTEMEMCANLGVSRNVLREAIKTLEITGVVSSKPGVGIVIQEFNPDFLFQTLFYNLTSDSEALLEQTMAVRRVLELGFLRESFTTLLPEDIAELKEKTAAMERIYQQKSEMKGYVSSGTEFARVDGQFHNILCRRIENKVLQSIIKAIWHCDRYHKQMFRLRYIRETVDKHYRIVEALERHDWEAYVEAMHHHFDERYKHDDLENENNEEG